jgi:membrane-associated HD superfamily phosphohydrolase
MSALVIISHVKDGAELARDHKLPSSVVDIIREHHGTTLVEYFYREAVDKAGDDREVSDQGFRYPGPKPRSKEAAVVMLADAVESASRTVDEPTPGRLEGLVVDIVRKKLSDGQFDDCGVTMADLRKIEVSLTKSLAGIFHSRIKYPGREL